MPVGLLFATMEPPANIEAEQGLLGAILINNAAFQRVAGFLLPELSTPERRYIGVPQ